jgi:hypothetical protein
MVSSETFRASLSNADETEDMYHDRGIMHLNPRFFSGAIVSPYMRFGHRGLYVISAE